MNIHGPFIAVSIRERIGDMVVIDCTSCGGEHKIFLDRIEEVERFVSQIIVAIRTRRMIKGGVERHDS